MSRIQCGKSNRKGRTQCPADLAMNRSLPPAPCVIQPTHLGLRGKTYHDRDPSQLRKLTTVALELIFGLPAYD